MYNLLIIKIICAISPYAWEVPKINNFTITTIIHYNNLK